ncbi:isochorismate synthase [Natronomonas sp. F2-12]|jgi:menaquinone-specific isochorismate synthase|uniref:isochorismate synthase n=1 Tax=Natronomonas aquatica TaxID=2841590 RepID=A0A9R1CW26_9EURY|nr:isochorismate synthase [Natronomonas aquatica]MCQ4334516.1 isochorismate synthase [Natronomonas aquatica]
MESLRSGETTPLSAGVVSRTVRLSDAPRPRTALGAADPPRTFWAAPGEATVVGSGAAATVRADGPDRFRSVRAAADELFSSGDVHAGTLAARPRLFGGFSFHDDHTGREPWDGYPGARFVLPRRQTTFADDEVWLTVNAVGESPEEVERQLEEARETIRRRPTSGAVGDPPGIVERTETTSKSEWCEGVTAAIERIEAGELRKVVLAQALRASLSSPLSIPDALTRLGETYPDCYRFLFEPDDRGGGFFGATPERLVDLRGRTVETGALAGTTGRGETPEEDEWLAEELLADEKNAHEHDLVVGAVRKQLEPHAASIRTGTRRIRRLATVQHIETPITAELASDEHVLKLVEALHPTPAVGGLPPDRALETIRDTEPFGRGWYAAPVGWFDAAGYGSFAVALRSAVARGDVATLFAGVGVVADSDPDREWDEVQLKYRPILDELE